MDRDEYANRLAEIAQELVVRVRDDDPEANLRWLTNTVRTHEERVHLLFVRPPPSRTTGRGTC
ncbi:hypothetical protein [Micromonospora echinospora]|uniref:hypothetical protein n=1 Tax=Micromonospora echinospora TaxID=1877 RepID=UPI003A89AD45